jgi:multidrug efflux pump subunit AcrA (membrane-fusion protein)
MRMPKAVVAAFIVSVPVLTLLTGCEKMAPAPVAPVAMTRPLLTLDIRSGRVIIPQTAIVLRGGIPGVFVLSEQNVAHFRMVRTGKTANGRVEILSGLHGTEILVMGDLAEIHDGSLIAR